LNKIVEVRDESGATVKGEVSGVRFQNGTPLLKVNDGEYSLQAVMKVEGSRDAGEKG